ncbi:hypothetical protein EES43_19240 [Streptomyces sp. ADI96-02]|uniref:hypothetical protein n=1 Tax=Streptomyces sp. ADI96-02 TaxID=1522760 RepID=UPI000F557B48|nr:hypothetical protein [Streptomyces sp. ADI96-02]RPK58913.1 hypothetical protein EES43_19240 [Streptomyces sp. ADI96-02]
MSRIARIVVVAATTATLMGGVAGIAAADTGTAAPQSPPAASAPAGTQASPTYHLFMKVYNDSTTDLKLVSADHNDSGHWGQRAVDLPAGKSEQVDVSSWMYGAHALLRYADPSGAQVVISANDNTINHNDTDGTTSNSPLVNVNGSIGGGIGHVNSEFHITNR